MKIEKGVAGLSLLLALSACGIGGSTLTEKDIGAAWPFKVSQVKIECAPTLALFVVADGKAYPLNGQAERRPELYGKGAVGKLNDIHKLDPVASQLTPDARMPLNVVTQDAIALCTKAGKWDISKG